MSAKWDRDACFKAFYDTQDKVSGKEIQQHFRSKVKTWVSQQWFKRNQLAVTFVDYALKAKVIQVHRHVKGYGCCFTQCNQKVVQVTFALMHDSLLVHTAPLVCHKTYVPVLRALNLFAQWKHFMATASLHRTPLRELLDLFDRCERFLDSCTHVFNQLCRSNGGSTASKVSQQGETRQSAAPVVPALVEQTPVPVGPTKPVVAVEHIKPNKKTHRTLVSHLPNSRRPKKRAKLNPPSGRADPIASKQKTTTADSSRT